MELTWTNRSDQILTLSELHPTSEHFEVVGFSDVIKPGEAAQLRVRVEPPAAGRWDVAVFADPGSNEGERYVFTFSGLVSSSEREKNPADRSQDPLAWVSVAELRAPQGPLRGATLVDIRPAAEFQECAIPGSLNIAPREIKVRTSLRKHPLVLISRGHDESGLIAERESLLSQGFKDVRILRGGINAWIRQGNPVAGRGDPRKVTTISARELVAMRPLTGWQLEGEGACGTLSDFLGIPSTGPDSPVTPAVQGAAARVLVVDGRESSTDRRVPSHPDALIVFTLSDGIEACLRQFLFQVAQTQRRLVTQDTFDMSSYVQTFRSSRAAGSCCGGR